MRTIEIKLFTFDELSESAKERAREWYRQGQEFSWNDESLESIQRFCQEFDVKLSEWCIGPYSPINYKADSENANFRGRKLRDFSRDFMPTGYCLDCSLWQTFYDVFKRTGDAKNAFDAALWQGFTDWRKDMEFQCTDEYIGEHLEANCYEFTENGEIA